uniref:Uncharacterized protein n=1 Tax=Setaria viridis TaxID=4556 RepID=A0A4U6TA75_SETVI|nr:hypothetical protein SEVIR_9G543500v2 [Setaria viridis]
MRPTSPAVKSHKPSWPSWKTSGSSKSSRIYATPATGCARTLSCAHAVLWWSHPHDAGTTPPPGSPPARHSSTRFRIQNFPRDRAVGRPPATPSAAAQQRTARVGPAARVRGGSCGRVRSARHARGLRNGTGDGLVGLGGILVKFLRDPVVLEATGPLRARFGPWICGNDPRFP